MKTDKVSLISWIAACALCMVGCGRPEQKNEQPAVTNKVSNAVSSEQRAETVIKSADPTEVDKTWPSPQQSASASVSNQQAMTQADMIRQLDDVIRKTTVVQRKMALAKKNVLEKDEALQKLSLTLSASAKAFQEALASNPDNRLAIQAMAKAAEQLAVAESHRDEVRTSTNSQAIIETADIGRVCPVCAACTNLSRLGARGYHHAFAQALMEQAQNALDEANLRHRDVESRLMSKDAAISSMAAELKSMREQFDQRIAKNPDIEALLREQGDLNQQREKIKTYLKSSLAEKRNTSAARAENQNASGT